ncbi:NUDIX hydrolase [Arenicella xantha]|uniref:NUDIX domain-containing protein n=1 Tax=Arenicella xantha TaxID=644221 RepID=A0A395JQ59_9GAMM|nr:NUDIX domain-containing protein [Arenicella xantha]RBP51674.1 NUDIX domain-containing protein [Arenicella xantha]
MKQNTPLAKPSGPHNHTVDNVIFGCEEDTLEVFLVQHGEGKSRGEWGLPGDWMREEESLEQAATRTLKERTGITDVYLEQLHTFSDVDRYPFERVLTTAFFALIRPDAVKTIVGETELDAAWFDINKLPPLIFDHKSIVEKGIEHLKHKVRHEPIGFNLLPKKFTLLQLQCLYEAVLGIKVDKPNFRRKMKKMQLLVSLGEKQTGVAHRAANLYRFDEQVYRKLKTKGFVFEL